MQASVTAVLIVANIYRAFSGITVIAFTIRALFAVKVTFDTHRTGIIVSITALCTVGSITVITIAVSHVAFRDH